MSKKEEQTQTKTEITMIINVNHIPEIKIDEVYEVEYFKPLKIWNYEMKLKGIDEAIEIHNNWHALHGNLNEGDKIKYIPYNFGLKKMVKVGKELISSE